MSPIEAQLFFARAVLLILLYGFAGAVGLAAWRELRAAERVGPRPGGAGRVAETPGARLIVLDGGASDRPPGTSFALAAVTAIGRDLDNEIVVQDPAVSGRHAVFNCRESTWWVEDLGSTNGTVVNGQRLAANAPMIVRSGDVIQVGAVRLRLVAPGLM